MTEEERKKLCDDLRRIANPDRSVNVPLCAGAAREIERLAAFVDLQQSVLYAKTDEIERLAEELEKLKQENEKMRVRLHGLDAGIA